MLKLLVGLVGLVEALYPERFLDAMTKLAYEYEGEPPTAKPWVVSVARIEGIVLLALVVRAAIKADGAAAAVEEARDPESTDTDSTDADASSGTVDRI